jgi:hypothetical protein
VAGGEGAAAAAGAAGVSRKEEVGREPVAKVTGAKERAEPVKVASKAGEGVGGGWGGGRRGKSRQLL